MFGKIVVVSAFAVLSVAALAPLQSPVPTKCARDDPNVDECLRGAIEDTFHALQLGNLPLLLPPLDPLVIDSLVVESPEGPSATLIAFRVLGIKDVVIESAAYTPTGPNSFEIYFKARVPNFDAAGTYTMQRGFFGANRPAAGPFSYTMNNYRIDFVIEATVNNGFAFITGKSSSFLGGENVNINFVGASKELNEALNTRINEFLQSYKAAADEKHPGLAALYSNLLFAKVPVERLFPSSSS